VADRPMTLADYLAILQRRKWIIIALPLIAVLTAFVASKRQAPLYKATASVSVDRSNAAATIIGTEDLAAGDPERFMTTQAKVARSLPLARRVVAAAGIPGETPRELLGRSGATPEPGADILDLSVYASNARTAEYLANAYARGFETYKAELDTKAIDDQLRRYASKIESLRARDATGPVLEDLETKRNDLELQKPLLADNVDVVEEAEGAAQVRPRPTRNAILAGLFGGVLAIGLAFLAEALDRRVRSEQEIEEALGLPLLGRVARPPRRLQSSDRLVMLVEPSNAQAETFRKLRTSLEFVNFDRGARTIMVTSAVQREGKSTTTANLAIALARAGRRVALVDLDLRAPFLHSFFDAPGTYGITDVVVNHIALERAIDSVPLPVAEDVGWLNAPDGHGLETNAGGGSNGRPMESVIHLLPCGTIPPAPDAFLESERVSAVLEGLSQQFDVVLIDAPPLLTVGDAMTLSTKVDAIVVAARVGIDRRHLHELARQLQNCRAPILGLVLTGVPHADSYPYGDGSSSAARPTTVGHRTERRGMQRKDWRQLLRMSGRDG
jgi:polysaccharide biosynthesis transport protein